MPVLLADALPPQVVIGSYVLIWLAVALQSTGVPVPAMTIVLAAAIYAGNTHQLSLVLVIGAAAIGNLVGGSLGFVLGNRHGLLLLGRFSHLIRLNDGKVKLGLYLLDRHSRTVVVFGRFVGILRPLLALLSGASHMERNRFLALNAIGGLLWSSIYVCLGYFLGDNVHLITNGLGVVILILILVLIGVGLIVLYRNMARLQAEAERALPGPLDARLGQL